MALFNVTSSPGVIHSFNSWITDIAPTTDGDLLVFGQFTQYNSTTSIPAGGIIKIDYTGLEQLDFDSNPGLGGSPYQFLYTGVAVDDSNNVFLGGKFGTYDGTTAANVVKLNPDGTINGTFIYGTGFTGGGAYTLKPTLDGLGNVYYCGIRDIYNGVTTNRFYKINATTGALDTTYDSNLPVKFDNTTIQSIHAGSGVMFLHGYFSQYGHLVKLNADGTRDTGFATGTGFNNAGVNNPMKGIICNQTGNLIMIGAFTDYNGNTVGNIIRINTSTGAIDTTFNNGGVGFSGRPYQIAQSSTGQLLLTGSFTSYNGTATPSGIILLNSDGSIDTNFQFDPGFGYGLEFIVRVDGSWFVAYNDYASKYYILRIEDNGDKEFI